MTRQQAGIMQTFPWFGKIAARTDAAAAPRPTRHRNATKPRSCNCSPRSNRRSTSTLYLAGATRITQENLELMQHFEEVARTKHLTAMATHPDIMRAQIEVAKAAE